MREMGETMHFKVNYQFREYHFTPRHIQHSAPDKPSETRVNLFRIHKPDQVLGLILTFYISFAMSARKTAMIMRNVFGQDISHQTVLNYAQAVAYYAHSFNLNHKGEINNISIADETYIKIKGNQQYVWFVLSESKHTITAYHISNNRETVSALTALNEAFKTAKEDQKLTVITDGLGSYTEAVQFLNKHRENKIDHIQVIGLQNKDDVSEYFRPFKQVIERFNRTYKHHVKPAAGFNTFNGAKALTTLFVTYYNFLRPHMALGYKTPIHIEQLVNIDTLQAKWVKLISMMIPV